jgi:hypothetical protein
MAFLRRWPLPSRLRAPVAHRRLLLALPAVGAALYAAPLAPAASASGLVVMPHTSSQSGLSYFKLSARPGSAARAGTIELRNPTAKPMRVLITPVDAGTLGTLGSSYAPPGTRPRGSALWLRVGRRTATLMPGSSIVLGVSVAIPRGAKPGDYLSGVSVEALDQRSQTVKRGSASIASASRYVIGTEVSLPGTRQSLIQFTGATLRREPSGLTFALKARNTGNTILPGVYGQVRVTRGGHTIVSQRIEPGTFVAHTAITYPVNAFREAPPQGTHYRISAWMRYPGGIARLNTAVTFGHRAAIAQQQYGGPRAEGGGTAWWKIAGVVAAILYGLFTTALLLRRRFRGSRKPILP